MPGHVFISYSRRDEDYVSRLVAFLEQAGLPVWLDRNRLEVGDRWEHEVRDRVDDCAAMIVVMTPAAEASPHVGNELQRARDRRKPILPVLRAGEKLFALATTNYFDARGDDLPGQRFLDHLRRLVVDGASAAIPAARSLVAGDLPGRAVAWQDRPGLLDALVRASEHSSTAVVAALAGQRGVGKTQLAAAYARLRIQHGWPVVVWANATTEEGIVTALDELAAVSQKREPDQDPHETARAMLRWLRTHTGPCLLVYDNAVDADLIRAWTPAFGSVQTVVTSTVRELDALGDLIDVSLFDPVEAAQYLRQRTGLDDEIGASELSEQLGHLPLALAQAGAIIGPGRRYPAYSKYLAAMAGTPTAKLLPHTKGDPYPHGLAEAVLLALDDLAQDEQGGPALRLLERLAVLDPIGADPVLITKLADAVVQGEADMRRPLGEADELVAILTGRSLTVGANNDRVVIHRLVQRVVRERCQQAGTLVGALAAAAVAVEAAAVEAEQRWEHRAKLVEHTSHGSTLLSHTPDIYAEQVLELLGRLLYRHNRAHNYSAGIAVGGEIVAAHDRLLGPDHPKTMRARNNLAYLFTVVGRHDEALELHARSLADYERVIGPDDIGTLLARNNLAIAYTNADRTEEALVLLKEVLADSERVLGPDHPNTLRTRNNVAFALGTLGHSDEALVLYARVAAEYERVLGPDHPEALASRGNLAAAYDDAGRHDEGIELHLRNIADCERALGSDHPEALRSRNNLAFVYVILKRTDEAIALLVDTLADYERVLGPDHPQSRSARSNLATAYREAGRSAEADSLLRPEA